MVILEVAVPERTRERAFEAFFRAHYAPLVRSLALAAGPDRAADVVHEAFLQASLRWSDVSVLDSPAGWVRRVAVNRLIDEQRRDHRRDLLVTRLAAVPLTVELSPHDLDLADAVAALPYKQRLAVCLYYLLDLPVDEVAGLLGASPGTVKSNLHDARNRLAQHLGDSHGR